MEQSSPNTSKETSVNTSDKEAFFTKKEALEPEKYLLLEYYFETVVDPELAAAHLCQEISTAQWKRVDVEEDFRPRFGAKVISIKTDPVYAIGIYHP